MRLFKKLGASLYIPATHPDLLAIANGEKLTLKSIIFCLEDSVAEHDLENALKNLANTLAKIKKESDMLRFVRVRHPQMLRTILALPGVDKLTGFVLPKFTLANSHAYLDPCLKTQHWLMPTLETQEVFDEQAMIQLRESLRTHRCAHRILALRIGGNDLLALLGLRRRPHMTIYETPLGSLIGRLVLCFRPYGFYITAPVFEYFEDRETLEREMKQDIAYGLLSKTAIHPMQVPWIEQSYAVSTHEMEMANALLTAQCPAVFKMHGAMCEVATHQTWAHHIHEQAAIFGIQAQQS